MNFKPIIVTSAALVLMLSACSGSSSRSEQAPETTVATTSTSISATTTTTIPATTTTLAPTGSVQTCEGFLTLDDPDTDGWGECIVTLQDAQEQYYVISGKINGAVASLNINRQSDCDTYLAASQTFIDELKAATWPASAQAALDELVAATEYELFVLDDSCSSDSSALLDEVVQRRTDAVFNFRTAIGSPTDF